ncbi:hypothetical protein J6590_049007 [Homalodisca vitripennis]|nr:hypothetical protein J6590_049007 [Homalodisca vitripennis]
MDTCLLGVPMFWCSSVGYFRMRVQIVPHQKVPTRSKQITRRSFMTISELKEDLDLESLRSTPPEIASRDPAAECPQRSARVIFDPARHSTRVTGYIGPNMRSTSSPLILSGAQSTEAWSSRARTCLGWNRSKWDKPYGLGLGLHRTLILHRYVALRLPPNLRINALHS